MPINIFKSKSQREISELEKLFEKVIDDLFENYESYTPDQKNKLREHLDKLLDLEKELNCSNDQSINLWKEARRVFDMFFGKNNE